MSSYIRYLPIALGGGGGGGGSIVIGTIDSQSAAANGASASGMTLYMQSADATHPGLVNATSQTFAGQKTFSTGLTGTLTGSASLNVLTSALGNLTDAGTDGIVVTGGTGATVGSVSLAQHVADTTHNGYLSSTDWNTFNGKQASGNYITALTGDGTASGPGSVALTLATVNSNVGSFGGATAVSAITVNAKGLVTAAASTSIQIAESQVTNLVSDLAGKQATGNYITALTGDVTASGPGSVAATIAANAVTNAKAAQMATNTMKGNNTGGTANAVDLTVAQVTSLIGVTTSTASSLAARDTNKNIACNNLLADYTTTATAAGTTTLTVGSTFQQYFTGSTTQTVTLPVASTLTLGHTFFIKNSSSGIVTVNSSGSNLVQSMAGGSDLEVTCILTSGTNAASWQVFYNSASSGTIPIAGGGTGQTTKAAAFDALSPMTTGGDIIYGGASGTGTRLANGSAGQVLTSAGTTAAPTWAAVPAANQSVSAVQTSTYAILTTDNVVLVNGGSAFTATLPTAVGVTGKIYTIKRVDQTLANAVTIATTSSQTIDGVTTRKLMTQYEQFTVISDGSNWQVQSHTYPEGWVSYTSTFSASFGTTASAVFNWRRVGDSIEVAGRFVMGSPTSSIATCSIPTGLALSSVLGETDRTLIAGTYASCTNSGTPATAAPTVMFTSRGDSTTVLYFGNTGANAIMVQRGADSVGSASYGVSVRFSVPIANWEA